MREFVKKEMWRSRSNYVGLLGRRVTAAELPSLVLPLACLALCLALPVLLFCYLAGLGDGCLGIGALLLVLWELPLLWVAVRKNRSGQAAGALCLLFLLNAYFFARGAAVLRRS